MCHFAPIFCFFALPLLISFDLSLASPSGKFLHITDLHMDPDYVQDGDAAKWCHRQNQKGQKQRQRLGPYGDHKCDSPMALVDYMLNEAKQRLPDPDLIIWTGDSLSHGKEADDAAVLAMIRNISDTIRQHFPDVPVVPTMGNHDSAPANTFTDHPEKQRIYEEIYDLWKGWIGPEGQSTFARGGYYRLRPSNHSAVFLVLNTNLYYRFNKVAADLQHADDPTGQFQFLRYELERARREGTRVHILAHIPPGAFEMYFWNKTSMEQVPERYNKPLVELMVEYAPEIRWMFFGHYHTDTFRIVKDSTGKPVQRFFASPAITPSIELNNPAFRVVEYNTRSLELEDIKTYSVDLDELNKNGAGLTRARLEYSMRDAYGGVDAVALDAFVQRLKDNGTMFEELVRYNRVGYVQKRLNATERAFHLCALEFVDLGQLEKCMFDNGINSATTSHLNLSSLFIMIIFVFCSIF